MKHCVMSVSIEAEMYLLWYMQGSCASKRHKVVCSFFVLYLQQKAVPTFGVKSLSL